MLAEEQHIEGLLSDLYEPEMHLLSRFSELKSMRIKHKRQRTIAVIRNLISLTTVHSLNAQRSYVVNGLYPIGTYMLENYDEANVQITQDIMIAILTKIIEMAQLHSPNISLLSYINLLFSQETQLIWSSSQQKRCSNGNVSGSHSFYQSCRSAVFQFLKKSIQNSNKYPIFNFLQLSNFALSIQLSPSSKRGKEQLRQLGHQLLLKMFEYRDLQCRPYTQVTELFRQLLFKSGPRLKETEEIILQGLFTANYLIASQCINLTLKGISLIQFFVSLYQQGYEGNYNQQQLIHQIQKLQVYNIIFSKPELCSLILQKNALFFNSFRRYTKQKQRALILIKASNILKTEQVYKGFLMEELNQQWSSSVRQEISELFEKQYFSVVPKQIFFIFKKISNIKQAAKYYLDTLQKFKQQNSEYSKVDNQKLTIQLEFSMQRLSYHQKNCQQAQKRQIFTQSLTKIFEPVSFHSTFLFNKVIADTSLWHGYRRDIHLYEKEMIDYLVSHNVSQLVVKYAKGAQEQSLKFYIFIFQTFSEHAPTLTHKILETIYAGFVKVLRLSNSNLVNKSMMEIINVYQRMQVQDMIILKEAFNKINEAGLSCTGTIPSILVYNQFEPLLIHHPKKLRYYKYIKDMIYTGRNLRFRREVCNFIMNLYYNISLETKSMDGVSIFKQFLQETIDQFMSCFNIFKRGTTSTANILGCLELVQAGLGFSSNQNSFQHRQIYSREQISLRIVNNINQTKQQNDNFSIAKECLFDKFLKKLQYSFDCQPEDISIFQNGTYISPVNYIYPIAYVLSDQIITLERSHLNPLKVPSAKQFQTSKNLQNNFYDQVRKLFRRLAVDGRMGVNQCLKYLNLATGKQFKASDKQVKDMSLFCSNKDQSLTYDDFLRYYKHKIFSANIPQNQIYIQLTNLNIPRTFQNNLLWNRGEKHYMVNLIKQNHHHFYPALSSLANHSDPILSDKAQKLLLFLPSYPDFQLTKEYFNFSTNINFEIYYKLNQIERRLYSFIYRQDDEWGKKKQLISFVRRQWINQISQKFKHSQEKYCQSICQCCSQLIHILDKLIKQKEKKQPDPALKMFAYSSQTKQRSFGGMFRNSYNDVQTKNNNYNIFARPSSSSKSNISTNNYQAQSPNTNIPNPFVKQARPQTNGKEKNRINHINIKSQGDFTSQHLCPIPNKACIANYFANKESPAPFSGPNDPIPNNKQAKQPSVAPYRSSQQNLFFPMFHQLPKNARRQNITQSFIFRPPPSLDFTNSNQQDQPVLHLNTSRPNATMIGPNLFESGKGTCGEGSKNIKDQNSTSLMQLIRRNQMNSTATTDVFNAGGTKTSPTYPSGLK